MPNPEIDVKPRLMSALLIALVISAGAA